MEQFNRTVFFARYWHSMVLSIKTEVILFKVWSDAHSIITGHRANFYSLYFAEFLAFYNDMK